MAGSEVEQIAGVRLNAIEEAGGKLGGSSPAMVTFPDAFRRRVESFPPPLKLEIEEAAENMSPHNVWQVYALGGFMILRWIWARWRERMDRGASEDSSA